MTEPLYRLTANYAALLAAAEAGEDITAALAALDDAIEAKAIGIVKVLATLEADGVAAGTEEARLAKRRKAAENAVERLREYIKQCMQAAGIVRVKTAAFSITLSDGKPRVEVHDLAKLPPELTRVVPETRVPDKAAILDEYTRDGVIPPGCDIVQTKALRVR